MRSFDSYALHSSYNINKTNIVLLGERERHTHTHKRKKIQVLGIDEGYEE